MGVIAHISKNPEINKILKNISWLGFEKIFKMVVQLFVSVWVARYLGPEKYGIINYVLAFVMLFAAFSTLGLDNIVIREVVRSRNHERKLLGTSFVLKIVGSILLVFISIIVISLIESSNAIKVYVLIIALSYLFTPFNVIDLWFQSNVESKYVVVSSLFSFVLITGLKIFFVLSKAPLIYFVSVYSFEIFVNACVLVVIYNIKKQKIKNWKYSFLLARKLMKESWPLMINSIIVTIYFKIDQVMIKNLLSAEALGFYSSAVRISELWYFIPITIISSFFPLIIQSKKMERDIYLRRIQSLVSIMHYLSLAVSILVMFLSPLIIKLLFGDNYLPAAKTLSLHVWSSIFVFYGIMASKIMMNEGNTKCVLYTSVFGLVSNILLNLILIPKYGINGAAIATLVSYAFSSPFAYMFFKSTRFLFYVFFTSFNFKNVINYIKGR